MTGHCGRGTSSCTHFFGFCFFFGNLLPLFVFLWHFFHLFDNWLHGWEKQHLLDLDVISQKHNHSVNA